MYSSCAHKVELEHIHILLVQPPVIKARQRQSEEHNNLNDQDNPNHRQSTFRGHKIKVSRYKSC